MSKSNRLMISASGFVLAASLGVVAPAGAQESDDDEARLRQVTISAQRRQESLQDVPIAVSAFSAEDLVTKQIGEPLDLFNYVPNIFGGNNTGLGTANSYYIRGLGNTESIATFDPPVGTYVDEIYIARQNANNVSFFDVEQIEVLRGPQGTLFGRNTTGGAVSIKMRKPAEDFGGYVEAGFGSFDRTVIRGSVDIPLADGAYSKFSAYWVDDEGYVDNITTGETINGEEGWGVRADLRFEGGDLTWDFSADIIEDESLNIANYDGDKSAFGSVGPGGATTDGDNRVSATGLSTSEGTGTLFEQALAGNGLGARASSYSLTSNLAWDISDNGTLNFITGIRSLEQDFIIDFFDGLGGLPAGGFTIANAGEHDQFSAELKYDGSYFNGALDIVTGLFYFTEDNSTVLSDIFGFLAPFPIPGGNRIIDNELTSTAAYLQADWRPADNWTITLGARWTEETKDVAYTDLLDPTNMSPLSLNTANFAAFGLPDSQTKALITPRLAIEYDFTDDVSVFASVTEGFKSGGWNARGLTADLIVPFGRELARNYEAGVRSILFDNRVRLNATAFFLEVEDLQTPSAFLSSTGSIEFITQNFSDLENTGLEIDFDWAVTEALNINAAIGLQDAEYTNPGQDILDQQAQCLIDGTGAAQGIVNASCALGEPVRVPDTTVTVGASYRFDIPSIGGTLTPSVNVRDVGETFTGTDNAVASLSEGYTLLNFGAALDWDDGNWSLIAECKNCTDEAYVVSALAGVIYYNEPRRVNVSLRRRF